MRFNKLNGSLNGQNTENAEIICLDTDNDDEADDDDTGNDGIKYYTVEQKTDDRIKKIPEYYMAHHTAPDSSRKLPSRTRIIARRNQELFPVAQYDASGFVYIYSNDDSAFYAGIISDKRVYHNADGWCYMVFFDDGHVQYVPSKNIRQVFGKYGTKHVDENAQEFYDYYFNGIKKSKLYEQHCVKGKCVRTFVNGRYEVAEMIECTDEKPGLVQLHFKKSNQIEWLYVGSPRFERIWQTIEKNKKLERFHQANISFVEVSSNSEDEDDEYHSPQKKPLPITAIDPKQKKVRLDPRQLIDDLLETKKLERSHACGPKCVRKYEQNPKIFDFDPLKRPLLAGWQRKKTGLIVYITPCGRSYTSIDSTYKYLKGTRSKLTIDCFSFSTNVNCLTEVVTYSVTGRQHLLNDVRIRIVHFIRLIFNAFISPFRCLVDLFSSFLVDGRKIYRYRLFRLLKMCHTSKSM